MQCVKKSSLVGLLTFGLAFTGVAAGEVTNPQSTKIPLTTSSEEAVDLYLEGRELLDTWRLEEAAPIFERVVAIDPKFVQGWVGLSWSQPRFKDMFDYADRALALLDEVPVSAGEQLLVRGFHASLNSDPESWGRHYRALAELHPEDERALQLLGDFTAFFRQDRQAALEFYQRSAAIAPEFVVAWMRQGAIHSLLGDQEQAEVAFRKMVTVRPEDPTTHQVLGDFQLQIGQLDEAVASYQRALEIRPLHENSERSMASVLVLQERHTEALARLRSIYEAAPNDGYRSGLHFAMAVVLADRGDFDLAIAELEKNYNLSAEIGDSLAMAIDLGNLAEIELAAGRPDGAESAWDRRLEVIVQDPDQPLARQEFQRVNHLLARGRVALARDQIERARELSVQFSHEAQELGNQRLQRAAHQLPGEIALATGDWETAIEELTASNPETAGNMFRIAQALAAKGDAEGARRMLQYVVDYRGVLNLDYALVRRRAQTELDRWPKR